MAIWNKITSFRGWLWAAFTVFVWGITFVNTKALLVDFSALEIQVLRFAIAYLALTLVGLLGGAGFYREKLSWRDEALFAGMGFFGVAVYQLLENCAIPLHECVERLDSRRPQSGPHGTARMGLRRGPPTRQSQPQRLHHLDRRSGRVSDACEPEVPCAFGICPGGSFPPMRTQVRSLVRYDLDGETIGGK